MPVVRGARSRQAAHGSATRIKRKSCGGRLGRPCPSLCGDSESGSRAVRRLRDWTASAEGFGSLARRGASNGRGGAASGIGFVTVRKRLAQRPAERCRARVHGPMRHVFTALPRPAAASMQRSAVSTIGRAWLRPRHCRVALFLLLARWRRKAWDHRIRRFEGCRPPRGRTALGEKARQGDPIVGTGRARTAAGGAGEWGGGKPGAAPPEASRRREGYRPSSLGTRPGKRACGFPGRTWPRPDVWFPGRVVRRLRSLRDDPSALSPRRSWVALIRWRYREGGQVIG